MMSTIALRNIFKRYGAVEVVHGIDLEVNEGEFVVLLGPSGCGKTTTLRMVAGLEDVSDGQLLIGGRVVNDMAPKDRGVAMVFQNYALYPHMTVRQNMEFALKPQGLSSSEMSKLVEKTAGLLELEHLLNRRPSQLSGGQRQRVAMARAMVRTPNVFLFDEPLSNLDAKLRTQVRREISKLHQRLDTTVLYVTHDQVEAMTLADRIVIMRDGHIEQVGTPEEVYSQPSNIFVATFIGSPAMNLIDVHVDGGQLKAEGVALAVPERFASGIGGRRMITIGIRPNGLSVAPFGSSGAIEAHLKAAEYLGDDMLLELRIGAYEFMAEVPAASRPGNVDRIAVTFDPDALHIFDRESGKALPRAAHSE